MSEYFSAAAGLAQAGASIYSLTRKPPEAPTIPSLASQGRDIGFSNALTTPGYGFGGGNLYRSPLGDKYSESMGGFLLGGGMDSLRARQTGQALGQIQPMREQLGGALSDIRGLRDQVKPGFGALTDARVTAIRDAAAESIGNLRDSLARRGVMGSSFADDSVSRTRLAYAREEQSARSEAKMAEIGMQAQFIGQELDVMAKALGLTQFEAGVYQQDIANSVTQSNMIGAEMKRHLEEFGVAGNIVNGVTAVVSQQAMLQAQLQLASQIQSGKDSAGAFSMLTSGLKDLGKVDYSKF